MLKMRTAPQRERCGPPKVRRGFASRSQNLRRATARAISLSQSDALATKSTPRRTAPQRERFDPPKVRRGFASRSQNVRRATARVSQSDVPATKSTPRRQSTVPATKFARKAPKCNACHEIQPKRSKVLRLSCKGKVSLPQTQNHPNCWTCHEIQL